jgi:NAD(P)-dependent dehydrogenase (short-subunit alcohol dehydrogenase family)
MYAASKGGINAMTRAMALSLGPYGIRVNAICPGFTATERHHRWVDQEASRAAQIDNLHALKRINQPEDIGQLVLYLASAASRSMTGAELLMDAGLSARLYPENYA